MTPMGQLIASRFRQRKAPPRGWTKHGSAAATALVLVAVLLSFAAAGGASTAQAAGGDDWPNYLFNSTHSGDNSADAINASNAATLKLHWTHGAGGSIFSQPAVSQSLGLVFWGSWDGYEHATHLDNSFAWATFLGKSTSTSCSPSPIGVSSSATIAALGTTPVVYVGGDNDVFYALNATNGQIIWKTSLGSAPAHYLWSSPALYNGSIYIGNASWGDCPLVNGQLVQLNATTGAIQHVFTVMPNGCTGGGVWGSPTVDTAAGFVYFATGNPPANNPSSCASRYSEAVVKVFASNVSIVADSWQARGPDNADLDFGSTPTLFSINNGASQMLGIGNKDGVYYVLNRNHMSNGPVWRANIAHAGDCPQCGSGTISPSAYDGSTLYVAGGNTSIQGVSCAGSVQALNPSTGAFLWRRCLTSGHVLGAVSVSGSPGVVFIGQGTHFMGLAASSGQTLFDYNDTNSGSGFWGSAAISNSVVYMGNMDGRLYAFGF